MILSHSSLIPSRDGATTFKVEVKSLLLRNGTGGGLVTTDLAVRVFYVHCNQANV